MAGALETIPAGVGPTTVDLTNSGDWVALTGQLGAGNEITLNIPVPKVLGSSNGLSTGFSVTSQSAANIGKITFQGDSSVAGTLGAGGISPSQVLHDIRGGATGTTVTFNGTIQTNSITFSSASTMIFNADVNSPTAGQLLYGNFNGTAIIAPNVTFRNAATNTTANRGILTLGSGSNYIGAVGDATNFLNQINVNGNASITGAIASQNIILGANTLSQTGAVTFPANAQITVRAVSDTVYGRINTAPSAINFTTGLQVNMLVEETTVLSGVPLQVVTGASGTFGPGSAPITTTSNNVRFTFRGENPAGTGNVLIFPTVVPAPIPPGSPGGPAASAFDAGALGATGDFLLVQQLVTALNNLDAIAAAEAQFAPTVNGGNAFMSFQAFNQFQSLWQSNLSKVRSANMCYPANDPCDPCAPSIDPSCLTPCHSPCDPCSTVCENAWNGEGLWLDGFGYFADQGTRMQIAGYDAKMYGGMIALQRPISKHWQVGMGGGYAYTDLDGKGIQKNGTHINTTDGTLYLGYTCGSWYLDNFVSYAWNHYKGFRHIAFPGLDRTARASYDGQEYGDLLSGGYNFFYDCGLTVTPLASLQYIKLHIDGYTETDAISLDLIQQAQNYDVLQSGLGLMLGYPISFCDCGTLYTEVHSKWYYDLNDVRIKNNSRFFGGGPAFQTLGVSPARNMLNLGVSTTLFTAGNLAIKASYEFNYRRNFTGQEGRATIGYQF